MTMVKKVIPSIVFCCMIFSITEIYAENESTSSIGVEFLEINIEPKNIRVGDSIVVYATVINNSNSPITFHGGCDSPIWIEFFSDKVERVLEPGCQGPATITIEIGQQQQIRGPSSGLAYKAVSTGIVESKVSFAYGIGDSPSSTETISETIDIQIGSNNNIKEPIEIPSKISEGKNISPHKQVSSGTDPNEVICSEGKKLVFKSTNGSPACVKPSTAEKLIQRGWARE